MSTLTQRARRPMPDLPPLPKPKPKGWHTPHERKPALPFLKPSRYYPEARPVLDARGEPKEFLVQVRIQKTVLVRVTARSCRQAQALAEVQTAAPVAKVLNDERTIGPARCETEAERSARETAEEIRSLHPEPSTLNAA